MDAQPRQRTDANTRAELRTLIEEARARLLDLSARNRLIHFSHTPTNCLRLVDELPDLLFERLRDGGTFTFEPVPTPTQRELRGFYADERPVRRPESSVDNVPLPRPEHWARHCGIQTSYELGVLDEDELELKHRDSKLQTLLYAPGLETRLRKLRSDANTAIEETGSNFLHLALGFLEWRETGKSDVSRFAPLILLPVEIARERNKRGKYTYRLS